MRRFENKVVLVTGGNRNTGLAIVERFALKNPIYAPTAAYGHFGRKPYCEKMKLVRGGKEVEETVQFFGWEKLDAVPEIRRAFGL